MQNVKDRYIVILLVIVAVVICFAGNGLLAVTDPVESNYALTAKEMMMAGDYISPRIFGNYWYDKPIFYYWELLASFYVFGMTEFAARFASALFGVAGVLMTYFFGRRLYGKEIGCIASLILVTTVEYFYLSKAIVTDMTLFVFFSAALICFYIAYSEHRPWVYYGAYVFAALAVLTKGPVGLLLPGLIAVLFLLWRHDIKELLHVKLFSGLILFCIIAGLWYVPMYMMHDGDFILNFIGVHNILRATVSEHPQDNVWYYYIVIFFLGFFPWVLTLPLAWKGGFGKKAMEAVKKRSLRLAVPGLGMKEQFLIVWAAAVFIFYQCMATKYMTYTFPYMIPLAIGFAAYLRKYKKIVFFGVAGMAVVYVILTIVLAVPMCREASAWNAARALSSLADEKTCVVSYGGRYPVSLAFYSGHAAYRLKWARDIPDSLPGHLDWNAKNVMPFMAIEDIPEDENVVAVVRKGEEKSFMEDVPGIWYEVEQANRWIVYSRKNIEKVF